MSGEGSSRKVDAPIFSSLDGLGILVVNLYGNKIEITSNKFDGTNYEYTVKYTYYDVFVLDSDDLKRNPFKIEFGALAGFRSWYILQHWSDYGGKYMPYLNYMVFEKTIKGSI